MKATEININSNPEEGIIKDNFSMFEKLGFSKQDKFPYCLIGKTLSEFKSSKISKCGVGILIGPSIVLTAGHNLTNIDKETGELQITDSVVFTVGANGDFEPFESIQSSDFHIPDGFIEGVNEQIARKQLLNDWAVVYYSVPIGETVKKLYGLEDCKYLKTDENGLFSYFNFNTSQNLSKLIEKYNEISIIGYSEYTEDGEEKKTEFNQATTNTTVFNDDAKKDINIKIQISTKEEGLVKSSVFSNHLSNLNIYKLENNNYYTNEPVEYVILNSEDNKVNKLKELQGRKLTGKSFLGESRGKLEDFKEALKYKISTYKGQSGSPIFLKVAKSGGNTYFKTKENNTDNESRSNDNNLSSNNFEEEENFMYIFIGIHSRRGPLLYENIKCSDFNNNEPENTGNFLGIGNNYEVNKLIEDEGDKVETQVKKMNISFENENTDKGFYNDLNAEKEKAKMNKNDLMSLVALHGVCEFNEGILLMGNNVLPISSAIELRKISFNKMEKTNLISQTYESGNQSDYVPSNNNNNFSNYHLTYYSKDKEKESVHKSSFCNVTLSLNGKKKLVGLFKRDIKLDVLVSFGAEILNIQKNYIFLKCYVGKQEKIINGNFDLTKKLDRYLEKNQFNTVFEIDVNMKYGEELGEIVLTKYMQNYDLKLENINENFKEKHMKGLFETIFEEIAPFSIIQPTFGRLFNKVRTYVLTKIGLID